MSGRHWSRKSISLLIKAAIIFTAVLVSFPAQTGQNERGSNASEIVQWSELKNEPSRIVRRVDADVCLTDYMMTIELMELGFTQVVLGENSGNRHLNAEVRYGADRYIVTLDRCTGRLQGVEQISTEASLG